MKLGVINARFNKSFLNDREPEMKIFSIDSSNPNLSISLYQADQSCFLASEDSKAKSSSLMPMVQHLFDSVNLKPQDIDLLVCNIGPGSFTGIRTAVTLVKTIAAELDLQIFVTNNFELIRFENELASDAPIAIQAGKNDYFISLDSDWNNIKTNFYATELGSVELYKFQEKNISKLSIEKYLLAEQVLFGYKELEPYYLREPSIGVKKTS